jgi:hypothetical protein
MLRRSSTTWFVRGLARTARDDDVAADFEAVRGNYDTNKFVRQMESELADLGERVERYKQAVSNG